MIQKLPSKRTTDARKSPEDMVVSFVEASEEETTPKITQFGGISE